MSSSSSSSPPSQLAEIHRHERDQYIKFDEGPHIYTVHGYTGYTSVTTFIHSLFSPFDETRIISNILRGKKWRTDPEYKYYMKSAAEIKEMWRINRDTASAAGTKMHYDIECYYNGLIVENTSIEYAYFLKFRADYPWLEPYRTEWCVFDQELRFSGSIDMVFIDRRDGVGNEKYLIYDWKRARDIVYEDSYGDKCSKVPCIGNIPDTNFWHYSLQLNIYRAILERHYGLTISGMSLVCLHPENHTGTYELFPVLPMDTEIAALFEWRRQNVNNMSPLRWMGGGGSRASSPCGSVGGGSRSGGEDEVKTIQLNIDSIIIPSPFHSHSNSNSHSLVSHTEPEVVYVTDASTQTDDLPVVAAAAAAAPAPAKRGRGKGKGKALKPVDDGGDGGDGNRSSSSDGDKIILDLSGNKLRRSTRKK